MSKNWIGPAALLVLCTAMAVACDDDDDETPQQQFQDGGIFDASIGAGGSGVGGAGGSGVGGAGGATGAGGSGPFVITIADFTFSPASLDVPRGATVIVRNQDSAPHSVTSQAMEDAYTPGSVAGVSFDTGAFGSGERSFVIPATAPAGTVVPYFCTVHKNGMKNDGQIMIH